MAQLAGKRPYPATLPNDFEVAHECDVRYLRTPFNLKSYAEPDVDYVRAISQIADMENENSGATLKRSEEHTSELQSLMRISYAVFCLKKKTKYQHNTTYT